MRRRKLSMIGAGSGFTITIAMELAAHGFFDGWEFCLMDIRADNLNLMAKTIAPILNAAPHRVKATRTTSLAKALDGSDYVITSCEPENKAIWEGDNIELIIETPGHSYYQIAISPSGAITDLDRKDKKMNFLWASGVHAVADVGDGYWSTELRVSAAGDRADKITPLIGISGRKPTAESPWYFNLPYGEGQLS